MSTQIKVEELPKSTIKITVTVPQEDIQPYLEQAAEKISQDVKIDGFRPGKANFEAVKQRVGEMKIYEEALESIVRKTFVEAVLEHNLDTVGSPKIDVEKLAPGNDIVYTAEVPIMPGVSKIADYDKLSVKAKKSEVSDQDMELAFKDLRRMQTKEVRAPKDTPINETSKVILSMNIKKDGVPVEGGQSPNHAVYMTEDYYIPGLKEKLIGLKEGSEETFKLSFPKDHVQKILAGSDAEFEVKISEVYNLELPELNDEFAKSLGQPDYQTLEKVLRENLQKEKDNEENMRQEREVLELLAEKSNFEDIPDLLVNQEVNKMIHELEHHVTQQGIPFEEYLKSIKKTIAELKLDFTKQAMTRIKIAILMKEIAKKESITAEEKQIDEELDQIAQGYEDKEAKNKVYSPEYREYIEGVVRNKNVIKFLKEKMLKA